MIEYRHGRMPLHEYLRHHARATPDKTAVIWYGRRISYAELDALVDRRIASGLPTCVVSIHSFTPRYHGVDRPWHVGVISHGDRSLADALLAALRAEPGLCIGDNLPYGPQDGVYHSLERHGEARGLRGAMIEVRNDLLDDADSRKRWAQTLRRVLESALREISTTSGLARNQ